ncbi:Uncharacterized protein FWK35_00022478 [Aphis craccivora]|uniref:CCHC-type domain-containing protein n=1 Tax=Aphis craccivora TaxID=307492 RepID=A0A6G0Y127_APHCR|nr:Uncharacterized protein FWK35_00022478 [Aphis craccivora]
MACLHRLQRDNNCDESHERRRTRTRRIETTVDHTAELNTPVVVPWTEVVKRNNHKGKLCHRPEAVMVQAEGLTFTDMLKKVKADREVQAVSANFTGIDMTRAGHLRSFTTNKGTQDREIISRTLQNAIGNNAKSITFKELTKVQISDVEEEATDDEILAAIAEKIGNIDAAFGHTRSSFTGTEVDNRCLKCGEIGHKSRDCQGNSKCFLCEKEATDDHILGSYKCHIYRRELEATKTK